MFEAKPDHAYFFRVSSKPGVAYPVAKVELLDGETGLAAARTCSVAATRPGD